MNKVQVPCNKRESYQSGVLNYLIHLRLKSSSYELKLNVMNVSWKSFCHSIYIRTVKFIYSEKATNFCKISTLLLYVCTVDKSKVEISQNFVAFSEYTNFRKNISTEYVLFKKCLVFR